MAADLFDQVVREDENHGMAYFLSAYCKAMACSDDAIMEHIDILFHGTHDMPVKICLMHDEIPPMLDDMVYYFNHLLKVMHTLCMRLKALGRTADYLTASCFTKGSLWGLGENWCTLDPAKDDSGIRKCIIDGYKMMLQWTDELDLPIVADYASKMTKEKAIAYLGDIDNTLGISVMTNRVKVFESDYDGQALRRYREIKRSVENRANAQPQKQGCYVATAVYGSYDCPQVWTLRRFRDDTLAQSIAGRCFIRLYYAVSPTMVKVFGEARWFNRLCKPALDRMVDKLNRNGVKNTPYEDSIR